MTYVALAEALAIMVVVVSFASIMRWQSRQSARREDLLVNQLCNLVGRPWQEAPATVSFETREQAERDLELAFMATPEQLP